MLLPHPPAHPQALSIQHSPPRPVKAGRFGHLPYDEAPAEALVMMEDGIQVRRNLQGPLANLIEAARKEGISLKVGAGFRSVESQRGLFESGAKKKGISPKAYSWWTAPPGYSEHHTGLAVDFVDFSRPESNFTPAEFVKTAAWRWLKSRGPEFGFELSFPEHSGLKVAFEPWHWRYVGDEDAKAIFVMARSGRAAQDRTSPHHQQPAGSQTPLARREKF